MVHSDGMATMTYRTTFSLDDRTIGMLKHLTGLWHTSQAEVVRRAIALAEEKAQADADATALLRSIHNSGRQLAREQAEEYLAELDEGRRSWRGDK